jgi:hypothetical protein
MLGPFSIEQYSGMLHTTVIAAPDVWKSACIRRRLEMHAWLTETELRSGGLHVPLVASY